MTAPELTAAPALEAPWRRACRRYWRALRIAMHLVGGMLWLLWLKATGSGVARTGRARQRWCLRLLGLLGVQVRVYGPLRDGPVLLVSNHVSWLDIPVIAAVRPCQFLAKAEISQWPLIGWLARGTGTLFIRRGGGEARSKALEIQGQLRAGHSVLIFPEGTTTDGRQVRRFFAPLFAAAGPAVVQPLAIRYHDPAGGVDTALAFTGADRFERHLWRVLGYRRIVVTLSAASPLQPEPPRALAAGAHRAIVTALGRAA